MKIIKRLIAVVATFQFLVSTPVYQAFAKGSAIESHSLITTDDNALEIGLSYLDNTQDEYGAWGEFGKIQTKTTYAPNVISDECFLNRGIDAFENYKINLPKNASISREWEWFDNSGLKWHGYTDGNGNLTSLFPIE